jgi:pyroglutamyl-peptidase
MKTKVLLTGFEPFAGTKINPSELVVNQISKMEISEMEIITAVLPVIFGESSHQLKLLIQLHKPDVVLALGLAEGRKELSLERIAINLDDARIPDNSGFSPADMPVILHGPDAYFSTLPIKEIVTAIAAAEIPVGLSLSAGTFVCNHLFYSLQHLLRDSMVSSGFMHLPLLSEQLGDFPKQPTMELEDMVNGVLIALKVASGIITPVIRSDIRRD